MIIILIRHYKSSNLCYLFVLSLYVEKYSVNNNCIDKLYTENTTKLSTSGSDLRPKSVSSEPVDVKVMVVGGTGFPSINYHARLNMNFACVSKSKIYKKVVDPTFSPPLCCDFSWKPGSLPPAMTFELYKIKTSGVFGKKQTEEKLGQIQIGMTINKFSSELFTEPLTQWIEVKDNKGYKLGCAIKIETAFQPKRKK
eukprot:Pgem_evm1s18568